MYPTFYKNPVVFSCIESHSSAIDYLVFSQFVVIINSALVNNYVCLTDVLLQVYLSGKLLVTVSYQKELAFTILILP